MRFSTALAFCISSLWGFSPNSFYMAILRAWHLHQSGDQDRILTFATPFVPTFCFFLLEFLMTSFVDLRHTIIVTSTHM